MRIERAFTEREGLSDHDLARLRAALVDEVQRYEDICRNYPADRMERYGLPYLTGLRDRVDVVDALLERRARDR